MTNTDVTLLRLGPTIITYGCTAIPLLYINYFFSVFALSTSSGAFTCRKSPSGDSVIEGFQCLISGRVWLRGGTKAGKRYNWMACLESVIIHNILLNLVKDCPLDDVSISSHLSFSGRAVLLMFRCLLRMTMCCSAYQQRRAYGCVWPGPRLLVPPTWRAGVWLSLNSREPITLFG